MSREIDALVAEHVVGFTIVGKIRGTHWLADDGGRHVGVKERGKPWVWFGSDRDPWLPCYSTDIAAAWRVVEKMRRGENPHFDLWTVKDDEDGEFFARFAPWSSDTPTHDAVAATAPMAIALAALKAHGITLPGAA